MKKINDKKWEIYSDISRVHCGYPWAVIVYGKHIDGHLMHTYESQPVYRTKSQAIKARNSFIEEVIDKINSGKKPTYIKKVMIDKKIPNSNEMNP